MPLSSLSISRVALWAMGLAMWLLAMLAALRVSQLDVRFTHLICGPWGCGPTLQALVACHLFWLILLAPPATVAAHYSDISTVRLVALTAIGAAIATLAGVAIHEAITWLPQGQGSYFIQRCLFVVVTTIELPIVQLLLLGGGGYWYAAWRTRQFVRAQQAVEV